MHCCLVAVGFHAGAFECDHPHDVPTLVERRICHVCWGLFDDAGGAILCWRLFHESSASRRTVKRSTQRDAGQEGRAPKTSVEHGYTRHNRHVPEKNRSKKPRAR